MLSQYNHKVISLDGRLKYTQGLGFEDKEVVTDSNDDESSLQPSLIEVWAARTAENLELGVLCDKISNTSLQGSSKLTSPEEVDIRGKGKMTDEASQSGTACTTTRIVLGNESSSDDEYKQRGESYQEAHRMFKQQCPGRLICNACGRKGHPPCCIQDVNYPKKPSFIALLNNLSLIGESDYHTSEIARVYKEYIFNRIRSGKTQFPGPYERCSSTNEDETLSSGSSSLFSKSYDEDQPEASCSMANDELSQTNSGS